MNLKGFKRIVCAAVAAIGLAAFGGQPSYQSEMTVGARTETYYCFATDTIGENFNGNYWSSQSGGTTDTGHTPTAGNTYVVESCCPKGGKARGGRVPANYTLPEGAKLVFQTAENPLDDTTPAYISLQGDVFFTASDATVMSGIGGFAQTSGSATGVIDGNVDVRAGAELDFITWNGCNRHFVVNAVVTGEGTICLRGAYSSATVGISGSLAGFKGGFRFDKAFNDGNASSQRPQLLFNTEDAFPGDPDELDARSVDLSDGAELGQRTVVKFNANGSFGAMRGVYVGENGSNPPIIYVEGGKEVTISGPISGSAGFIKRGNGALYLADACKDLTGTVVIEEGAVFVTKDFCARYSEQGGVMNIQPTYYNRGSDSGREDFFTADIWAQTPDGAVVAGHHPPKQFCTYVIEPDHGGRLYSSGTFAGTELIFQESEPPKSSPGYISFSANTLSFTVPKMTVKSGIGGFAMAVNSTGTLNGNVEVCAGAELLFRTWNGCDRHFVVNAAITGEGAICLQGAHASASTTLNGSLAGFTGGFRFDKASNADQSATVQRPQLVFNTEDAFPGDPDELDARSVDLSDGAALGQRTVVKFNADGSLGATRGVYVGKNGSNPPIIYVEEGMTVTIQGPLSGSAGLIKEGGGTLKLSSHATTLTGTVSVRGGTLWYAVQPEGCVIAEDGGAAIPALLPSLPQIKASLVGYTKTAAELLAEKHVTLDITEPAGGAGCTLRWSYDGMNWSITEPQFAESGFYTVYCKVSAEGYQENILCARVEAALSVDGDTAFVAPPGASDPVSPYDTPATAANLLSDAAGAGKSKVVVASGCYDLWARETIDGVRVFGPADRSAVFARNGLVLGSGTMLSGVTFDDVDGALDVKAGAVVSNCCVKGGQEPVSLGGLMTDCTVCDFVGGSYGISAANDAVCVRSQIVRGTLTNMADGEPIAPIIGTGGGIVTVTDCTIGANTVYNDFRGAGAFNVEGTLVLNRCRVVDNSARFSVSRCSGRIAATNSLFTGNLARTGFCYGEAEFVNCTIANNSASEWGFYSKSEIAYADKTEGYFRMVNTIVANNVFGGNTQEEVFNPGEDAPYGPFDHSLFPYANGMAVGAGNIDANEMVPKFIETGDDPCQLDTGSAGLNAGSPLDWTNLDVDLLHSRRVSGNAVDMGCYERVLSGLIILFQ